MGIESDNEQYVLKSRIAYITIDDGPNIYTEYILNILKFHNVKATFFVLEPNMNRFPELMNRMVKEGHSVGLHGVTHEYSAIYESPEAFISEMKKCNDTLEKITGIRSQLIRAPYGSNPYMDKVFRNMVNNEGFILWDWNVDSTDSLKRDISSEEVISTTKKEIKHLQSENINPVLLFHSKSITEVVFKNIIKFLKKNNYTMDTLEEDMTPITLWDNIEKEYKQYKVVEGDTLHKLSRIFDMPLEELKTINNLTNKAIYPGKIIYVKDKASNINAKPSKVISYVRSKVKEIAFTYDAGFDDAGTKEILDILKIHHIKCTFFLTGYWVERFPHLAKRIVEEGHEIGNHTYKHPDLTKISCEEIKRTVLDAEEAIKNVTGVDPKPWFRQPFGEYNDEVLRVLGQLGYEYSFFWSIDTLDWEMPPARVIANRILRKANNGDIVLMHLSGKNTAEATKIAVRNLIGYGYKFVTVSQLIK